MSPSPTGDDWDLLQAFAKGGQQAAFAQLVRRYAGLVQAAALRRCSGDTALADDVTQAVFLLLSRRASHIKRGTAVAGWLVHATRYTAANAMRMQRRRMHHEHMAARERPEPTSEHPADQTWPMLHDAIDHLAAKERDAILLRYFDRLSVREIATRLGIDERAAAKRLARGLARLRAFFASRKIEFSELTLAGALGSQALHAAPEHIVSVVLANVASPSGASVAMAAGAWRLIAWGKLKAAIVAAAIVCLPVAGGAAYLALPGAAPPAQQLAAVIPVASTAAIVVEDLKFDSMGPGKNVLHVIARNTTGTDRTLTIAVTARSDGGRSEWKGPRRLGVQEFKDSHYLPPSRQNLPPGRANDLRYVFQIPEPYGPGAAITVELFDQGEAQAARPMQSKQFVVGKLPQRDTNWLALPIATDADTAAAEAVLAEVQLRLRVGLYGRAQQLFSDDWQSAEQTLLRDYFRKRVYLKDLGWHTWDAPRLLNFSPRDVRISDRGLVLIATDDEQIRPIELLQDAGKWKIDWIHRPMPGK